MYINSKFNFTYLIFSTEFKIELGITIESERVKLENQERRKYQEKKEDYQINIDLFNIMMMENKEKT